VKRFFSKRQRKILALIAGGSCQKCGQRLDRSFHADHIVPVKIGGPTTLHNGQALCSTCNIIKGSRSMILRPWQQDALNKAIGWL